MRSCTSMAMNVLLALMFVQAPFFHVHAHESTEQHSHRFLHTHLTHTGLSTSKTPEVRGFDPDDDAHFLDWFTATIGSLRMPLYLSTPNYSFPPTVVSEKLPEPTIRSGHDPPRLSSTNPRAPPI